MLLLDSIKFAGTHLYTKVERGCESKVSCLRTQHNVLARARTWTACSRVKHTSNAATTYNLLALQACMFAFSNASQHRSNIDSRLHTILYNKVIKCLKNVSFAFKGSAKIFSFLLKQCTRFQLAKIYKYYEKKSK